MRTWWPGDLGEKVVQPSTECEMSARSEGPWNTRPGDRAKTSAECVGAGLLI